MAVVAGYGANPHYQTNFNPGPSLFSSSSASSHSQSQPPSPDSQQDQYTALFCKALYDYTAQDASALSFRKDDIIEVLTQQPSGWWDGLLGEERGWFPSNYVVVISEEEAEVLLSETTETNTDNEASVDFGSVMMSGSQTDSHDWLDESSNQGGLMELASSSLVSEQQGQPNDFWMPEVTPDGQVFYVNHHTGQRSRDLPRELDEEVSSNDLVGLTSQPSSRTGTSSGLGLTSSTTDLTTQSTDSAGFGVHRRTDTPEPWIRKLADDGMSYYYWNKETNQVQWTRPETRAPSKSTSSTAEYSPESHSSTSVSTNQHTRSDYTSTAHTVDTSVDSRRLSIYSDDSDIQPPEMSHIASTKAIARNASRPSTAPHPQPPVIPSLDFELGAHALQQALTPPPPKLVAELSATARDTIHAIAHNIPATSSSLNADSSVPGAQDNQLDACIQKVVVAVRNLLYVSAAPTGHIPSNVLSYDPRSAVVTPSSHAALKPAQRKVTATLSKLVLSARAMEYEFGLTNSDAPSRIEGDAEELDRAVLAFVAEVERHQMLPEQSLKRLHATFLPPLFNFGATGSGSAGKWTGFGWAPTEQGTSSAVRKLSPEVLSEVNMWISSFWEESSALKNAVAGASVRDVSDSTRHVVSQLSSLSSLVASIHLAGHIDIDGVRPDSGPILNDAYIHMVEKARELVRALESVVQSLFDDAASLLLSLQCVTSDGDKSSTDASSFDTYLSAIQDNLKVMQQTLESAFSLGNDQAGVAYSDYIKSIGWRTSRTSIFVDALRDIPPLGSLAHDDEEEVVDFELALDRTRPPRQPGASIPLGPPASNDIPEEYDDRLDELPSDGYEMSPDGDLTPGLDDVDPGESKPQRPGGSKLIKLLGPDAPSHIVNAINHDSIPWYLRPSTADIVIEPDGNVRGGTLPALVERLTAHDNGDSGFNKTFLMTFKSFTTINELFDLLVARFYIQPPPKLTPAEREEWGKLKQHIIQMRVLNTFKSMVVDDDVLQVDDIPIFDRIKEFLSREEVSGIPAAKQLNILIDRARGKEAVTRKVTALQAPPPPIIPKTSRKLKLLDIDPLELARQLTIMESDLYQKITPVECIQRSREQKDDHNDNITTVIQTSNRIADWVAESILDKEDSRKRAAALKHFINIADKCRMLHNFSTMVAITSGLNTPPIRRLKRTWEHVPPKSMSQLAACESVLESTRNFNSYRSAMSNITPPCVPFIGVFLTTLTFIQDGSKDKLPGDMINFRKRQKASEVILDIKRWQAQPFLFTPVPSVLAYIEESLNRFSDATDVRELFWNLSLEREPREREDERMARLLQESGFL